MFREANLKPRGSSRSSHTGLNSTLRISKLHGPGWLMLDQQLGAETAGNHGYRIKHLPLE